MLEAINSLELFSVATGTRDLHRNVETEAQDAARCKYIGKKLILGRPRGHLNERHTTLKQLKDYIQLFFKILE